MKPLDVILGKTSREMGKLSILKKKIIEEIGPGDVLEDYLSNVIKDIEGQYVEGAMNWLSNDFELLGKLEDIEERMDRGITEGVINEWYSFWINVIRLYEDLDQNPLEGRVKKLFPSAEIRFIKIRQEDRRYPSVPAILGDPCYACGETLFWISSLNASLICGTCHPPSGDDVVAGWIERVNVVSPRRDRRVREDPGRKDFKFPVCRWCLGTSTSPLCSRPCQDKRKIQIDEEVLVLDDILDEEVIS